MSATPIYVVPNQGLEVELDETGDLAVRVTCSDWQTYVWAGRDADAKIMRLRSLVVAHGSALTLAELCVVLGEPTSIER